jgi:hypothetical protein
VGKKTTNRKDTTPSNFDRARDELYSHILRCGVLDAAVEHQQDWFNDTMEYLAERYDTLTDEELAQLRTLGEMYCRPVVKRPDLVGANTES